MKIAIVGDQHASYLSADYNKGISNLPAWDVEFKQMVEELLPQDFDRIYISPGYFLMGVKKAHLAIGASARTDPFIPYEQEERGFYHDYFWRHFIQDKSDVIMLLAAWRQAVKVLYDLSDKIWILPISLYWYEMIIDKDAPSIYGGFRLRHSRCINVAAILKGDKSYHKDELGNLSKSGIEKINEALRS